MAPEQLEGEEADSRTDIFAFGALLYEMVTGRKAFRGKSQASLIAAILEKDPPPVSELQPVTPPALDQVVKICLAKDPDRRWQSAADGTRQLEWIAESGRQVGVSSISVTRRAVPGALALVASAIVGAVLAGVAVWSLVRPGQQPGQPIQRFAVNFSTAHEVVMSSLDAPLLALSPDGASLVHVGSQGGTEYLYLRPMDRLEATLVRGTEGARHPFFSPDSQWIGFFSGGKLKKVSVAGGLPVTLCDTPGRAMGGTWTLDNVIYFGVFQRALFKVSAAGGDPQAVTRLDPDRGEMRHGSPAVLPRGKAILFTSQVRGRDDGSIDVLSLETGERRTLLDGGTHARYAPSGHLVYAREGSLLAVPFDPERLEITGSPIPVLEGVHGYGRQFSLSRQGTLAYIPGDIAASRKKTLVWVDRHGVAEPLTGPQDFTFQPPRLSPDGRSVAVGISQLSGPEVWILEMARGTLTRLTFAEGAAVDVSPVWAPDGKRIFFGSSRGESPFSIFSELADGGGDLEQLATGGYRIPTSLSSDGKVLVFRERSDSGNWDIGMLRLEGEHEPEIFLGTSFDEHSGILSRDDRWLAYVTNESGRDEVYVRPFPGPGGRKQVSTEGGREPMWSRDGNELFYRHGDKMMAVSISATVDFNPGKPTLLFEERYVSSSPLSSPHALYDVSQDGRRFLMMKASEEESTPKQINIVLNWHEELRRLVPTNE